LIGISTTVPPPVIAQQYSSATFVLWRLYSRKENYGAVFKHVIVSFFTLI
jgi:hypothetical protein